MNINRFALLLTILSVIFIEPLANAQSNGTCNVTWNLQDFASEPQNVSVFTLQPYSYMITTNGTNISIPTPLVSVIGPSGQTTIKNVVCGFAYKASFISTDLDGYQRKQIFVNYFPTNIAGSNVNAVYYLNYIAPAQFDFIPSVTGPGVSTNFTGPVITSYSVAAGAGATNAITNNNASSVTLGNSLTVSGGALVTTNTATGASVRIDTNGNVFAYSSVSVVTGSFVGNAIDTSNAPAATLSAVAGPLPFSVVPANIITNHQWTTYVETNGNDATALIGAAAFPFASWDSNLFWFQNYGYSNNASLDIKVGVGTFIPGAMNNVIGRPFVLANTTLEGAGRNISIISKYTTNGFNGGLRIGPGTNIYIHDLDFSGSGDGHAGFTIQDGTNILIENCEIDDANICSIFFGNNFSGIGLAYSLQISNVIFRHNIFNCGAQAVLWVTTNNNLQVTFDDNIFNVAMSNGYTNPTINWACGLEIDSGNVTIVGNTFNISNANNSMTAGIFITNYFAPGSIDYTGSILNLNIGQNTFNVVNTAGNTNTGGIVFSTNQPQKVNLNFSNCPSPPSIINSQWATSISYGSFTGNGAGLTGILAAQTASNLFAGASSTNFFATQNNNTIPAITVSNISGGGPDSHYAIAQIDSSGNTNFTVARSGKISCAGGVLITNPANMFSGNGAGITNTFNSTNLSPILFAGNGVTNTTTAYGQCNMTATSATWILYNSSGNPVETNTTLTGQEWPIVAPGGKIVSSAGTLTGALFFP